MRFFRFAPAFAAVLSLAALASSSAYAQETISGPIVLRPIGSIDFPNGYTDPDTGATVIGGLSGIAHVGSGNNFYALSDDPSGINPARFYGLSINLSDGFLNAGDIDFTTVRTLREQTGPNTFAPFGTNTIDPEGFALSPDGQSVYVSSEGFKTNTNITQPFIRRFNIGNGTFADQNGVVNVATGAGERYNIRPFGDDTAGPRSNLVFESLNFTPNGQFLYTATENALNQDGLAAAFGVPSPVRVGRYDPVTGNLLAEFLYNADGIARQPTGGAFAVAGLVDILFTGQNTFLSLERSLTTSDNPTNTNEIKIYQNSLVGATDISGINSLLNNGVPVTPIQKTLLFDFNTLGIRIDNIEGISFGPRLSNGNLSLIAVSDNNFAVTQTTQFIAFEVVGAPEPPAGLLLALGSLTGGTGTLLVRRRRKNRRGAADA